VKIWLIIFNFVHFMAAFWAVFTFGGSGSAIAPRMVHRTFDLKQEIQIQTDHLQFYPFHGSILGSQFTFGGRLDWFGYNRT
jgi:hypothetical protein